MTLLQSSSDGDADRLKVGEAMDLPGRAVKTLSQQYLA